MAKDWSRTNHRLTVHPRTLAKEILADLKIGSTSIMRYYEQHGYRIDNESIEDLIVRTVQAHVIYGEDGDVVSQLKELRYNLKEIEWVLAPGDYSYSGIEECPVCQNGRDDGHEDNCWLDKELR